MLKVKNSGLLIVLAKHTPCSKGNESDLIKLGDFDIFLLFPITCFLWGVIHRTASAIIQGYEEAACKCCWGAPRSQSTHLRKLSWDFCKGLQFISEGILASNCSLWPKFNDYAAAAHRVGMCSILLFCHAQQCPVMSAVSPVESGPEGDHIHGIWGVQRSPVLWVEDLRVAEKGHLSNTGCLRAKSEWLCSHTGFVVGVLDLVVGVLDLWKAEVSCIQLISELEKREVQTQHVIKQLHYYYWTMLQLLLIVAPWRSGSPPLLPAPGFLSFIISEALMIKIFLLEY